MGFPKMLDKTYHVHNCHECKRHIIKPEPWLKCSLADNFLNCLAHEGPCTPSEGVMSPVPNPTTAGDWWDNDWNDGRKAITLMQSVSEDYEFARDDDWGDKSMYGLHGLAGRGRLGVGDPQQAWRSGTTLGYGICLWGKCRIYGTRCTPDGYCPEHCAQFHADKNNEPPPKLEPATLIEEASF